MRRLLEFVKKETVLCAAWLLAAASFVLVRPGAAVLHAIDFRSLGILWSLMSVMAGLRAEGFFDGIGRVLLGKVKNVFQLCTALVFLCFFLSMFITNDVALITFVPFAVYILHACGKDQLLVPVVVLQTLAANLGSMLTPVGNPQNLYLYGLSGMPITAFVTTLFPYALFTAILLVISLKRLPEGTAEIHAEQEETSKGNSMHIAVYGVLFVLALLSVLRVLPWQISALAVLAGLLVLDRGLILKADYGLLMTFVGFFLFTGTIGELEAVKTMLTGLLTGREVIVGVLASQVISNVPAALLLSAFTADYRSLLIGVNLGGLGTLIASMASLISYKAIVNARPEEKGIYFRRFTIMNLLYLVLLLALWAVLKLLHIA